MYTSGYANRSSSFPTTTHNAARTATENAAAGLVSEVVYHEDQPMMAQLLLLPLLPSVRPTITMAALAHAAAKAQP